MSNSSSSPERLASVPHPRCECGAECTVSNGQWVCPACGLVQESLMVPSISSYRSSAVMRRKLMLRSAHKAAKVHMNTGADVRQDANTNTDSHVGAPIDPVADAGKGSALIVPKAAMNGAAVGALELEGELEGKEEDKEGEEEDKEEEDKEEEDKEEELLASAGDEVLEGGGTGSINNMKAKYYFRLAHTICRLASLVDIVAEDAAALALRKPLSGRDSTVHVLAAVMYTSARMGGVHVRLPGEWEEVIRQLNLRRPGRTADGEHRPIKMWTVLEYMRKTYGPLPEGCRYWDRFLSLLPLKAVRRASILLEAPKTASQAGGAILLADYDSRVTDEDLIRLKIRPDLARAAMRSLAPGFIALHGTGNRDCDCDGNGNGPRNDNSGENVPRSGGNHRSGIDMSPFHTLYRLCDLLEMPWYVEEAAARRIRRHQLEGKSVGRLAATAVLYALSLSPPSTSTSSSSSASSSSSSYSYSSSSYSPPSSSPKLTPSAQPTPSSPNTEAEARRMYETYRVPYEWTRALREVGISMGISDILYNVKRRSCILNGLDGALLDAGGSNNGGRRLFMDRFVYRVGTIAMVPKPRLEALMHFVRLSAGASAANPALTSLAALSALGLINLHDRLIRARLERAGISIGHRRKRQIRLWQIEEEKRRMLEMWAKWFGREPATSTLVRMWFGSYRGLQGTPQPW